MNFSYEVVTGFDLLVVNLRVVAASRYWMNPSEI